MKARIYLNKNEFLIIQDILRIQKKYEQNNRIDGEKSLREIMVDYLLDKKFKEFESFY